MKSKLGSGSRFRELEGKLSHEKGIEDPAALAASIGRKKYGEEKMEGWSKKGKREEAMEKAKKMHSIPH